MQEICTWSFELSQIIQQFIRTKVNWMCFFRWMHTCTFVYTFVVYMLELASVHPLSFTHFPSPFQPNISERMQWKMTNNRRITEIIWFNYIYIYFCLSSINTSFQDSRTEHFSSSSSVQRLISTELIPSAYRFSFSVFAFDMCRLIAPIYSIETVLVC